MNYQEDLEIQLDDQIYVEEKAYNHNMEKSKGAEGSISKKIPYYKREPNDPLSFHIFPTVRKLFWCNGLRTMLFTCRNEISYLCSRSEGSKALLKKGRDTRQSNVSLRHIGDKKYITGEISFREGVVNINNLPFSKHNDREKAHSMMVSHYENGE